MDDTQEQYNELLRHGAQRLTGHQRRLFQAQVCLTLCHGNPRQAERRFGWGRHTVQKGLHEYRSGVRCLENFQTRGARRSEDKNPQLAADTHRHAEAGRRRRREVAVQMAVWLAARFIIHSTGTNPTGCDYVFYRKGERR
jgi:transposase